MGFKKNYTRSLTFGIFFLLGSLLCDAASAAAPVITVQPMDLTVSNGAPVSFTVTATGSGSLSYEWWVMDHETDEWLGPDDLNPDYYSGINNRTITLRQGATKYDSGDIFYCIVRDYNGNSVKSNQATLTVSSNASPTNPNPTPTTPTTPEPDRTQPDMSDIRKEIAEAAKSMKFGGCSAYPGLTGILPLIALLALRKRKK